MTTGMGKPKRLASLAKRRAVDAYGNVRGRIAIARARRTSVGPGLTVVTANWNTLPFLRVFIATVQARSPEGTKIIVVDNASSDGSREYLRGRPNVESILLPMNIRHGRALDLAVASAVTDTVVVLDIDAFPTTEHWLDESLRALADGKVLSGAYFHRNFIHPCFLVMRRDTLVMNHLSFKPIGSHPSDSHQPFGVFLDVGEALSQAVIVKYGQGAVHQIPNTEVRGPDMSGTVFGNVVYHNFHTTYSSHRADALARFAEAVERFGASGWADELADHEPHIQR